jgi:hypothetical protein
LFSTIATIAGLADVPASPPVVQENSDYVQIRSDPGTYIADDTVLLQVDPITRVRLDKSEYVALRDEHNLVWQRAMTDVWIPGSIAAVSALILICLAIKYFTDFLVDVTSYPRLY